MRNFSNQNLLVLFLQSAAWIICLEALHILDSFWAKSAVVVFFCLMMQGVFSLMHDCIHGLGHNRRQLNYVMGWWTGVMFGTPYSLFQVNHQGHHIRNRTPAEIAEYILPGESRLRKTLVYYFAILGGIWFGSFLGLILFPFVPYSFVRFLNKPGTSMNGYSLSFKSFDMLRWTRLRAECLTTIVIYGLLIRWLEWRLLELAFAYVAFAFSWSSLQWVYHLRTPLDPIEGAYNLRSFTPVRWLFLNFNYNLTHHRHPELHWQELHQRTNLRETQPSWYRYLLVFRPPEPLPKDVGILEKKYF
ncbi:MAG: fatty acid desaturase [Deltaproteobacteria bacterium]|jgi:fatty acid desaturase|nr:fatty acid desaturase [Deltaproteobacteria bacterium]